MNHHSSLTQDHHENPILVGPRGGVRQFVSEARIRADHYFCNRLNVADLDVISRRPHPGTSDQIFSLDVGMRPGAELRGNGAGFADARADGRPPLRGCGVVTIPDDSCSAELAPGCVEPRLIGYTVAELEELAILQALKLCAGNRTKAARMLGLSVRTLQRKLGSWKHEI